MSTIATEHPKSMDSKLPMGSAPAAVPKNAAPTTHRLPRFVIPVVVLGVLFALLLWRFEHTTTEAPNELTLQGNVDVRQVNLSFKVPGRIEKLLVDEGDSVKAGQPIAKLDARYFEDDLKLARAQKEQAAANYERTKNGARTEEKEQARANEREREATLKRAERDYRRAESLVRTNTLSTQEFDQAQAAFDEAVARLKSSTAARQLTDAGSRVEDIDASRAQFDATSAQLIVAERRLADSTLYAPNDGTILTRAREGGAIVNAGETVFTLTLSSPVWIRTYVDEPDLGSVKPGMAVRVVTDAASGRSYWGRVGFISPTAEFTPKTVETQALRTALVYRVRIVVDDPDGGLRQGMPASTVIESTGTRNRSTKERLFEAVGLNRLGFTGRDR